MAPPLTAGRLMLFVPARSASRSTAWANAFRRWRFENGAESARKPGVMNRFEELGQRGRPRRGQRDAGRVVRARLQERAPAAHGAIASRSPSTASPSSSTSTPIDLAAELLEQVEHRRERRVLDDDPVAEAQHDLGDAVERVHRPVDDGHRLGRERPRSAQHRLELGQHRMVEVARRQRLAARRGR